MDFDAMGFVPGSEANEFVFDPMLLDEVCLSLLFTDSNLHVL
jgi:hypothetical protein